MSRRSIWILGGNRGIGLEMARQLGERGDAVHIVCRTHTAELDELSLASVTIGVDLTRDDAIGRVEDAVDASQSPIDMLITMAGVLERNDLAPLDVDSIRRQFEINALAPLRFVSALSGRLRRGGKVALITSRMGSIADNTSGSHYGYRMSKAALNAAGCSLAHDLRPEGVSVCILHPGYVRTRMTRGNGLIDADESARLLLERIDDTTLASSGRFLHANGDELPW